MEIKIYVEGGGHTAQQRAELRQGLDELLGAAKRAAQQKDIRWTLACYGGRDETFKRFKEESQQFPDVVVVLLVDSEGPFVAPAGTAQQQARARLTHLQQRDGWAFEKVNAERVHLMVQCMEAWIVADPQALEDYYGSKDFARKRLPTRPDLEDEPKPDLYSKLEAATKKCQKGAYGKIKHAGDLLKSISPDLVAQRCRHFNIFTNWLDGVIASAR